MLWIGITGPMGSGKSTVSASLREMGYPVLDADEIVRTVLSPGSDGEREVLKAFGTSVRGSDGVLDRRALARVVFGNPEKLDRLERIIHPRVREEVARQRSSLAAAGAGAAFYDVPLLFEKKMEADFDHVLVVSAAEATRLARLIQRTGLSVEEIQARWQHHLPPEHKEAHASAVIVNNGDLAALRASLRTVLSRLGVPLPSPAAAKPDGQD